MKVSVGKLLDYVESVFGKGSVQSLTPGQETITVKLITGQELVLRLGEDFYVVATPKPGFVVAFETEKGTKVYLPGEEIGR